MLVPFFGGRSHMSVKHPVPQVRRAPTVVAVRREGGERAARIGAAAAMPPFGMLPTTARPILTITYGQWQDLLRVLRNHAG
ncbi:hypothetical protein [Actinomadura kijaniata]|uniref:hypothetical protein n=1 Tax=Actinomadura kijaniata TaxID=46161 RepID=UPI0016029599